ncbi:transferrin [Microplitis mediator]|uniref:transferrin n=1 Tax=Microplitis mediator TaxID=375433 RepID=UPI002553559C|nr:transferrin [Microplitis mediator]
MGKLGIGFLALSGFFLGIHADGSQPVLSMCVPEIYWKDCVDMMKDSAAKGIPISCIAGRDRYECVEKVGRKEADIVAVDPEDMYLAAKNNFANDPGYNVVEQIRTKEEPDEPHRYEAVAVIHKDLEIFDVQSFRGLNSCHTGVGRNVGYKIPITKLTAMGVLANINDPEYSARENEIRALSTLFNKGCLVGTWSPDPEINKKLKEKYSNMCALCEDPVKCDYPDKFSGYDGALRCLAHNGGQVAFTKVIYVKRFFGLPVGKTPAVPTNENPSDFAYFCPDGTKVPIDKDTKPCTWAARPWQGYMTNGQVHDIPAVQKEIEQLGALGENEKAAWWKDLLLLDEKTIPVSIKKVQPEEHLENSKYLDVIERNSGAPERDARWCVWCGKSLAKCQALAKAAHSRDARPRLDCVREKDREACLTTLRNEGVDLVVISGGSVKKAIEEFNVKPIIAENYTIGSTKFSERPAVAVIMKDSPINKLADLKDKKSCHTFYKHDFAGWLAPVQALKKSNLITSEEGIADFFSGSCAPGASKTSPLCQQCVGDSASQDDQTKEATRCENSQAEAFSGGRGAIRCLTSGKGDVAFVPYTTLQQIKNDTNSDIKISDLKLLCPNGGVSSIENYEDCNFGYEPPRVIVTHAGKSDNVIDELTHGVLTAATLYSKRPDLLQLFGSWGGRRNVLFKDDAIGLVSVNNTWDRWDQWAATEQAFGSV